MKKTKLFLLIGKSRGKKRQLLFKLAKKLLRTKKEQLPQLKVKGPSNAFLEEDVSKEEIDPRLPSELIHMLRGVRVFGFFDKPLFLELCQKLEFITVPRDDFLFCIGDEDDSIYIVQSGKLSVFISEADGIEYELKKVETGDMIASLLSVLDVLAGNLATYKTVSAKAIEDSVLLRLQVKVFKELLDKYPESFVRVVQIIMVRLQRVMFTALHHYLGLTSELISSPLHTSSHKRSMSNSQPYSVPNSSSPEKSSPARPSRVSVIHHFQHSRSCSDKDTNEIKSMLKSMAATQPKISLQNNEPFKVPDPPSSSLMKQKSLNIYSERKRREGVTEKDDKLASLSRGALKQMAIDGFRKQLSIDDETWFKDTVSVKEYDAGVEIVTENCYMDVSLFYVLSGSLTVSQKNVEHKRSVLFIVHPGEIVGALEVITSEMTPFTVTTRHPTKLGVISKTHIYEILAHNHASILPLALSVIRRLSPFVRQVDFALDWIHYDSGRALYRQADSADFTYIVLSGRLRSVIARTNDKKEFVGEFGRGDIVGIVEVLTQTPRSTSVIAVRDSELAKLPNGLLDVIKIKYPSIVTRLIHLLGHRILGSLQNQSLTPESIGSRPTGSDFSTVALLSASDDVPLEAFCLELNHAVSTIGSSLVLTSELIRERLGVRAFDVSNEYRLSSWLGQQEDQHRLVLYQCDKKFTPWTYRCIRQADCILIVALADSEPIVGKVEQQLDNIAVRTQKELILLHEDNNKPPTNTVSWLNIRSWCSSHHHIRCSKRMFIRRASTKMKEYYSNILQSPPDLHSDFSRLARFLTGTSIGLVLGGGGARGSAHVGMIKALIEAGIPIDMVGGVSIGAFMGALYCQEMDLDSFVKKARQFSKRMTSYWSQIIDLTYPMTAMFTGSAFNRIISEDFGNRQIEDLWLPFFCVTTDITSSSERVHRHGSVWRYVRSSMSLSGYLPPLCDPIDGHLLLDGGYVNNLPADIMRDRMGAETILAVDVGSQDDTDLFNYGDTLSGWWLLWKRWNPFSEPIKVPSLPEIQSRLAFVSCVRQLERVKSSEYCTYIRPPIDKWKTLQFGSFDEIMDIGYNHGKLLFSPIKIDPLKSFCNREVI